MTDAALSPFKPDMTQSPGELLLAAQTPADKVVAGRFAMELLPIPGMINPVPRLFADFQWSDDEEIIDQIVLGLLTADNLAEATQEKEKLPGPSDVAYVAVTVHDVRAKRSDVEDAKWGAYLMIDVELPSGERIQVSGGGPQLVATFWRCQVEGLFPVQGEFVKLGNEKVGRNQPDGFRLARS